MPKIGIFDFKQYDVGGIGATAGDGKLTGEEVQNANNAGWCIWDGFTQSDTENRLAVDVFCDGTPDTENRASTSMLNTEQRRNYFYNSALGSIMWYEKAPFRWRIQLPIYWPKKPSFTIPKQAPVTTPEQPPFSEPKQSPATPNEPPLAWLKKPRINRPGKPPIDWPNHPPINWPNHPPITWPILPPGINPNNPPAVGPDNPPVAEPDDSPVVVPDNSVTPNAEYSKMRRKDAEEAAQNDDRLEYIGNGGNGWRCSDASFKNDIMYATKGTAALLDKVIEMIRRKCPGFTLVVTSALGTSGSPHSKKSKNSHYNPENVKLDFGGRYNKSQATDVAHKLMATGFFQFANVEYNGGNSGTYHIDAMFKPDVLEKARRGEL